MWPSSMSSSSTDYDCDNGNKCGKCQNHDFEVLKKGHARDCPFKKCICLRCRLLDARSDILQVISGKETKLKGTKKDPNCGYCQNHGVKILRKGHVRSCAFGHEGHFQRDNCFDCEVHFIRNEVNRLQIKMRRAMKEDKNITEEQRRTAREAITRDEVEKVCSMARCARERRETTIEPLADQQQVDDEDLVDQKQHQVMSIGAAMGDNANSVWRPWSSVDHSVAVQLSLGALTSMAMNQYYLNHMTRTVNSNGPNSIASTTTTTNHNGSRNRNRNRTNNNNVDNNDLNAMTTTTTTTTSSTTAATTNHHNGVVNYTLNRLFAVGGAGVATNNNHNNIGNNNRVATMVNIMQQQQQQQQQQHQQQQASSLPPSLANAVACDLSLDRRTPKMCNNQLTSNHRPLS